MRLKRLTLAGFRGIKGSLELSIPPGFVVITGRNGSGKSTICDAIEYALSGGINRQLDGAERSERLSDYYWWRGSDSLKAALASVVIEDDDGNEHSFERAPSTTSSVSRSITDSATELLCDVASAPSGALERLLTTAIIRDEEITRWSVDLPERHRFELVRAAVGESELPRFENTLQSAQEWLDNKVAEAKADYDEARQEVERLIEKRSELSARVGEDTQLDDSIARLRNEFGDDLGLDELLVRARSLVADMLDDVDTLVDLATQMRAIQVERQHVASEEYSQESSHLRSEAARLASALESATARRKSLEQTLAQQRETEKVLVPLAELLERGRRVGLQDEKCPLCGSAHSHEEFEAHITRVQETIAAQDSLIVSTSRELAEAEDAVQQLVRLSNEAESELTRHTQRAKDLADRWAELQSLAREVDVEVFETADDLLEVGDLRRDRIRQLQSDVDRVERSRAAHEIAQVEQRLSEAQQVVAERNAVLERADSARDKAKKSLAAIKRIEGETVDDRLASMGPLLDDLYGRLRAHIEWQRLSYRVRGDVRRFVSLEVGDNLNPKFMFSSGQRRAIGIAFLLAANLTTHWSRLKTLVMDDPVQHVDDYRALHLVELLASLRKAGRQIVLTVEDPALADLAVRRLRGVGGDQGSLVKLRYDPGSGVAIDSITPVDPISKRVLKIA